MRRYFFPYIATVLLSFLFFACNSGTEKVNAKSHFGDDLNKPVVAPLVYEDTTSPAYRDMIHKLDAFFDMQSHRGFNGSVLVGYKGKVLYERYHGLANRETGQRLTKDNAVQLASISKTFTGTAVLYLYEHKYLDIDEKVNTYIKDFPYTELTLRMLLNHRSGLPDYTKWVPSFHKDTRTPISNDEVMRLFAQVHPRLEFRANTRFKYSNSNYAVLASVVEAVSAMRFPDFMHKIIFAPLGMNNTFIYSGGSLPSTASISYKYNWVREPNMFADGVYGDKNVYSTVEDMYRWDQSFYKNLLLNEQTTELAYGPCSFEKKGIKNYGLGWRMLCYPDGDKVIYHNGWWHGNNTSFYRFIKYNFTIIILGNKYNTGIYHFAPTVYSIVNNVEVGKNFDTGE